MERALTTHLEGIWTQPDEGIWEVRGPRQCFTHSKVMSWVAFDRAVKAVEGFGLQGPVDRWRAARDRVHAEVCEHGWDAAQGCFVQAYGSSVVDASLLLMPLVGFLPATDPRMAATVETIRRELSEGGLVRRMKAEPGKPAEGAFLACSCWMADCLALQGRHDEAREQFERVLAVANDLGLLAEEYNVPGRHLALSSLRCDEVPRHADARAGSSARRGMSTAPGPA